MDYPTLIIGYGTDGLPKAAVCSECGEWMPEDYEQFADADEIIFAFFEHFKRHVRECHPPANPHNGKWLIH